VPVGQLGDPVLQGDRARDRLVPLARVGQEALGIDVDRASAIRLMVIAISYEA
jgi:hypothetical protein